MPIRYNKSENKVFGGGLHLIKCVLTDINGDITAEFGGEKVDSVTAASTGRAIRSV